MTTPFLLPRRRRVVSAANPVWRAACSGALLGLLLSSACVISIHDHHGDSGTEACIEEFEECIDDAEEPAEFDACEIVLEVCLDAHEDDDDEDDEAGESDDAPGDDGDDTVGDSGKDDGDGDAPPDEGDAGDDDPPHADSDEQGDDDPPHADDGDEGEGDDDPPHADTDEPPRDDEGDTSDPEPDCFETYADCIFAAQTLAEVEACTVAFEHCVDPGSCDDPDCGCAQ
jgi:hypothetical protein